MKPKEKTWRQFIPTELVQLLLVILLSTQVNSQCFGGTETYEKTTGVKFLFGTSQGILTQPGTGITRDCTAICRQTQTCRAFTVDYENSRCQSYTMDSAGQRNNIQDKVGSNFFEKICLLGVSNLSKVCDDRMWAFERVVGAYLEGFDDREERNVQTKAECEKLCLFETTFTCRSAEFDETQHICRLSREDRRSQPNSFRRQLGSPIDYLENQCVRSLPDCRYTIKHDSAVISMDELQFAATYAECEALCKQTRAFTCRAFTYAADEKRCYLSGDDSVSLSNAPLVIKRGAVYAEKQCSVSQCEDGIFTFEKVTGHFLRSAQPVGLAMATSPGVTLECSKRCLDAGSDCPAFSLDYNGMKCFKLDRNTQGRSTELSPREGQSYFEKICLHGNIRACSGKAWAFERRPAKEIRGFDDKKVPLVQSRRDCAELCLNERRFECRSAEYDVQTAECRLSREDRRSQPNEYIDAPPSVEYLENQCLPPETYCNFEAMPNSYPRYLDVVMPIVSDESECERRCHTYSEFTCRSYSYYPSGSQCFMSGDDRASAGSDALMSRPGTNYFERNCRDLSSPGNNHLPHPGNPITDPQGTLFSRTEPERRPATNSGAAVAIERCPAGRLTFEKITGHELQGQQGYPLLRETVPGITEQCARRCQSDPRCRSFNLDYTRNDCVGLGVDSELARIDLRPTVGMAYFESICLRGGGCGLAWTFERHMNFELRGFEKMRYPGISKTECEDRCLEERQFSCRSATYNHRRRECRLSTEDRFTQPQAFVAALDSDYLENQCSVPLGRCVYRNQQRDRQLLYTDKSISAFSDSSCQHACDVERGFVCRSYTFLSQTGINTNQCLLSGDTGATAGTTGFLVLSGALYAEKECSGLPGPGPHQPPTDPYNPLYPGGQSPGPGPFPPGPAYPPYPTDSGVQPYPDATDLNPYPCRYTLTYEKIAGAAYPNSRRDPIRTRGDIGITAECLVECAQQRDRCLAISLENVRGGRQRCYALDRSSDSDNAPLQPAPDLGYFQKICLRERPCAKAWAFTRVPSYEFVAPNSVDIRNVFSRRQCQDECLRAARITCRSATYYKRDRICKLSPDTRRTHPEGFHRTSSDVDYMENECAPQPPNCEYTDQPGRFLPYSDRFVARAYDVNECRRLCDQEREFQCRSFNFHIVRRECFLSSDDAFTADRSALLSDRDFFYSERGSCSNVRVDCTQSDMLVTFLFGAPFEGRVYATGNPQACFEMGSGQSQLVLRIPMGTQCGTVQQGRGRYVNHVVIQQNPVIMQETDKTVRVECSFDASDQTVSYAPSGTREQEGGGISVTVPFRPSGTNIVTNTAPTPNVRMRILLRNGQEAAIVGLGEPLQLRIESDPSSAFGIYARNLEARTDNGELLTLIDNSGCPRDPDIFPSLELEPGSKDLIAEFKAFRFPSTATVNFVSTIHFCQDGCEPVRCYNGVPSYGRRRRSAGNMTLEETTDGSMSTEENHHTEITTSPTTSETVATFVQEEMTSTEPMPEDVSNSEGSALPQGNETTSASPTSSTSTELPLNPSNDFHPRGPEIRNELSTRAPPRPTTTSTKSPTSTKVPASGKEPPNVREPAPMPGIPNELPLQLQLVVGEDSIPKPTKNNDKNRGPMNGLGGKGTRPEFYPAGPYGENAYTEDGYVCSPKSTVIASVLTLLFFNAGLVGGFIFFYRVKKKQWEKLSSVENVGISPPPHNSARPAMFAPEVLFRNVYDRLPPNPTFSTLGHLSSTGQGNLTSSNPIYETAS